MKTIFFAVISFLISTQALAWNNTLECGGQNAEGQTVRYLVDWNEGKIMLNMIPSRMGTRPFLLELVQTWKIEKSEIKNTHITVHGYTQEMTTGTVGRITVTVKKSDSAIYQGTVVTKAPSMLVRPVTLVTTPVTCRFR